MADDNTDAKSIAEDADVVEALKRLKIAETTLATKKAENAARVEDLTTEEGKLEERKRIKEAEKAIAEAEKGTTAASFPIGKAEALEGTVQADEKAGYVAELVGYDAMHGAADSIAAAINEIPLEKCARILIVDTTDVVHADVSLEEVKRLLGLIQNELKMSLATLTALSPPAAPEEPQRDVERMPAPRAIPLPAVPLAIGAATSVVSQLADLLSYLRTDYTIKGRVFQVGDIALMASVAGRIKAETRLLGFYRLFSEGSCVKELFDSVLDQRAEVQRVADQQRQVLFDAKSLAALRDRIRQLKASLESAKGANRTIREQLDATENELAALTAEQGNIKAALDAWQVASVIIDANIKGLVYSADAAARPILLQALVQEQAQLATHLLYIKVSSSGGETIFRKSLWPWANKKVNYLGGGAVTFLLATRDGRIIAGDTITLLHGINYDLASGNADGSRDIIRAPTITKKPTSDCAAGETAGACTKADPT